LNSEELEELNPSFVEISVIGHATESLRKVKRAVLHVLPEEARGISFSIQNLKGHYGNPIFTLKASLRRNKLTKNVFKYLLENLPREEKESLANEIDKYIDGNGDLYLRFDKQDAFLNKISVKQEDPIRVRVRFKGVGRRDLIETIQRILRK